MATVIKRDLNQELLTNLLEAVVENLYCNPIVDTIRMQDFVTQVGMSDAWLRESPEVIGMVKYAPNRLMNACFSIQINKEYFFGYHSNISNTWLFSFSNEESYEHFLAGHKK